MNIRCITYFCSPGWPLEERVIEEAGAFLQRARAAYEAAGYEVQFTRLATVPFPKIVHRPDEVTALARGLEALIRQAGIAYASLGPALPDLPQFYQAIPEALRETSTIFFGGMMTDADRGIDVAAARACAKVIVEAAPLEPNGFVNLRFAGLANVLPGSPFFPSAYHDAREPAFAVATEAADLAVQAFGEAQQVAEGQKALVSQIEQHAGAIARIAQKEFPGVGFRGIDFCLAPFPEEARSIGTAMERLGVTATGLHGSLSAAAILTDCVNRAQFPHIGFSGLLMPVLEDATLARRAAEGTLTVKDVLLYSAVCGTGLDTIPLPGDTTAEQLLPLLLDLCALALRLDKPLTARLMPVPGKQVGDETHFDFGFFANSRVMALDSMPLSAPLANDQRFDLHKR